MSKQTQLTNQEELKLITRFPGLQEVDSDWGIQSMQFLGPGIFK